jgi:simple sugar transport system ATP-binding protein
MASPTMTAERVQGTGAAPVLEVRNVSKHFDAVRALDDVSLTLRQGEVVGLVGDNGAGKSTLIKIISGVYAPDGGEVLVDGEAVHMGSPHDARELGIETVYQHLALVNELRVDGNLFLGREPTRFGALGRLLHILDIPAMKARTREAMARLHINIPGLDSEPVHRMSGGQRQAAAIARAVHWGSKLLLLDEPTAALGAEQSAEVQRIIRRTCDSGIPAIVISHNLQHVFEVCDRIVVLRLGRKVLDVPARDTSPDEVVAYITGSRAAGSA